MAANDDNTVYGGRSSNVAFNLVSGTTYFIAVDGYNGQTGTVTLNWNSTASPAVSPTPLACIPPPKGLVTWFSGYGNGYDLRANPSAFNQVPLNNLSPGLVGQALKFSGGNSVDAHLDLGQTSELTVEAWVRTSGTTADFQAVFSSTVAGEFLQLRLDGTRNNEVYTDTGTINLPIIAQTPTGVWRHLALSIKSGDTRLYVNGTLVGSSAHTFSTINPLSTGKMLIGAGLSGGRFFLGDINDLKVYNRALSQSEIQSVINAGSNGLCLGDYSPFARTISGSSGQLTDTNAGASDELATPGGASVWYNWQAPASGSVTFTTAGSNFDTLLRATDGTPSYIEEAFPIVNDTLQASSDEEAGGLVSSRVTFNAVAGTKYLISVDGYNGQTGNVTLSWGYSLAPATATTPANDNFASAKTINGDTGSISGTSVNATKEANEPNHAGSGGGASVWYRWQAPVGGTAIFTTDGTEFDTLLGVYTGSSVSALTQVAANDDRPPGITRVSRAVFTAVAGTTYFIAVDGLRGVRGKLMLNWSIGSRIMGRTTTNTGRAYSLDSQKLSGGGLTRYVLTDANGKYEFTNLPVNTTYTLKAGTYSHLTDIVVNANTQVQVTTGAQTFTYSGTAKKSSGSGAGTPYPGVTLVLTGGSTTRTAVTDQYGAFTFTGLLQDTFFTLTPQPQTDYAQLSFSPDHQTFTAIADVLGATFDVTEVASLYSVGGLVRDSAGSPLSGVTMTLSGGKSATTQTDSGGFYAFAGLMPNANYTVTPTLSGVTFTQPQQTFPNLSADQKTADFVAAVPLTISGVVRNVNQRALNNITVNLSGDSTASKQTDNSGAYSFTVQAGGTYEVKPSDPRVTDWLPLNSLRYTNLTQNVSNANFEARFPTFTVSGLVKTSGGTPLPGAIVKNGSNEYVANSNGTFTSGPLTILGDYSFIPQPFTHQTMPFGTRYNSFNPSGREFFSMTSDVLGLDFTASPAINVVTSAATSITSTSATINGSVNPNGAAANAWFFWGSESAPNTNQTSQQAIGAVTTAQPLTVNLTGLTASTTYYFRAVGTSSAGTGQGTLLSFTTSVPSGPTIFTEEGSSRAIALDAVTQLRGPFRVLTPFNFSSDRHTRVMLFTSNFTLNAGDALTVTVQGNLLPIENVGTLPGVNSASFIVVRLVDQLLPGDLAVVVTLRGLTSNTATITISP